MRKLVSCLVAAMCVTVSFAQQSIAPQTARQALLEMFFGKESGAFVKHLPTATRAVLDKSGALAGVQQYSAMMSQMEAQGQSFQTFETGSVLLTTENAKTGQKVEITVENDALRGDQDDLDVAFHMSKDGKEQSSPFMPQMTFSMKQEAGVWRLNEISFTVHLPLADPDFLKTLTERMTPQSAAGTPLTATARPAVQGVPAGSDSSALAAMRTILAAEVTYAKTYPQVGFTCTLSDLDGFGGGEPNEHQAMLINSGLASGKRYGFVFTLSGCGGTPASSFRLSAAPSADTFGRKAFCADQSAVIRASDDGNPAKCFASGVPVQ